MTVESNSVIKSIDDATNLKQRLFNLYVEIQGIRDDMTIQQGILDNNPPADTQAATVAMAMINVMYMKLGLGMTTFVQFATPDIELSTMPDWNQ